MKKFKLLLTIFTAIFLMGCIPSSENCDGEKTQPLPLEYETVLVQVKSPIVEDLLRESGVDIEILQEVSETLGIATFKADKNLVKIIQELLGDEIISIQPNYSFHTFVNDPLWEKQWNFRDGAGGANIEKMWSLINNPGEDIKVAVIDTGVDYSHEDMGCVLKGKDFIANDDDPMDENGHGTHVSGTIAEITDNGIGAAGITKSCIVPVRVLDAQGSGNLDQIAEGIIWACKNNINIINMSLGANVSCEQTQMLQDAINYCIERNVVVVVAAGNSNSPQEHTPASCNGVISVAAVRPDGERASYSNCGDWVDIAAPGGDNEDKIWQSIPQNKYEGYQGTSMASPHVAGIVAIALQQGEKPKDILKTLCQYSKPAKTENIGCGIIDAYNLIKNIKQKHG